MPLEAGDAIWRIKGDTKPLEEGLDKASDAVKKAGETVEKTSKSLVESWTKAGKIIAGVGAAITGAFVGVAAEALNVANDVDTASRKMAAALGEPTSEAERFGEIIKQVYKDNFGESIEAAGQGVQEVALQMQSLGGVSDDTLTMLTESAFAIQDAYGEDVAKSINSVKTLMSEFGISALDALDFVAGGFQKGLNSSEDFLDSISEYAPQFSEGGATAAQFFSLLQTGLKGGVIGTDKAADAFGEFRKRILDGSTTTSDALAQIGVDADTFTNKISTGNMTVVEAFSMVIEKLRETTDGATQMQAGVGLLGTQFEDIATSGVLNIDLLKTSLDDLQDSAVTLQDQYLTFGNAMSGLWRMIQIDFFEPIGRAMLTIINEHMPQIQAAVQRLADLGPVIAEVFGNALDFVLDKVVPMVETVTKWVAENQGLVVGIVELTAVIGPLALGLGTVLMALKPIIAAVTLLKGVAGFGGLATAATGTGSAMTGLTGAGAAVTASWLGPVGLLAAAGAVGFGIGELIGHILDVTGIWKIEKEANAEANAELANTVSFAELTKGKMSDLAGAQLAMGSSAGALATMLKGQYVDALKAAAEAAGDQASTTTAATATIAQAYGMTADSIDQSTWRARGYMERLLPSHEESPSILSMLDQDLSTMAGMFENVVSRIGGILDGLRATWSSVWDTVSGAFSFGGPQPGQAMSAGGAITKGHRYTVGESGPELLIPKSGRPRLAGLWGAESATAQTSGYILGDAATKGLFQAIPDRISPREYATIADQVNAMFGDAGVPDSDKKSRLFMHSLSTYIRDLENAGWRAEGGPVKRGLPYIVGEGGPELFMPKENGVIVPNGGAVGGGGSGPVTIDMRFGDVHVREDADIQRLSRALASEIGRELRGAGVQTLAGALA